MKRNRNKMSCKGCKKDLRIVNKFHSLCLVCNNKRLEAQKSSKVDKSIKNKKQSRISKENRLYHKVKEGIRGKKKVFGGERGSKSKINILLDEAFYEQCFNACSDHRCEECGVPLNEEFRNEEGIVILRSRYSHIVPKSIAPELRRNIKNINHLCTPCHTKWDFGTSEEKKSMKIYKKNSKKFPQYFK